jgi:hypothetical protein
MASGIGDNRPERVYGILVRDHCVYLTSYGDEHGLPGGVFRPLAEDRKVELAEHIRDQLGVEARAIWAQGAFRYRHPLEEAERFSGFYTVWEFEGVLPQGAGAWFDRHTLEDAILPPSLRILLLSVLSTEALRTR